jgi:small nuclear ribonucleoprotein B and B'
MLGLINWRLKVTINDGRAFIGQMLAFDKHMNLVLADCEEFRHVRPKKKPGESESGPEQEMKRSLGLVILRGETVVSLSVEGPPPVQDEDKKNAVCVRPPIHERSPSHSFPFLVHLSFLLALVAVCQLGVVWEWCLPVRVVVFLPYEFQSGAIVTYWLHSDSWPPGICETPDAIRATWHARRTSRFPPSRISAGSAFPPSSWVRWSSPWVRRSSGMLNGKHADQCDRFQPPPQ